MIIGARRFARDPNDRRPHLPHGRRCSSKSSASRAEPFTGTETGTVTDIFLPMAMKNPRTLASPNNYWLRTLVQLKPGVDPAARSRNLARHLRRLAGGEGQDAHRRRSAAVTPRSRKSILLEPAAAGRSNLQRDYRRSLTALAILVAPGAAHRVRQCGQPDDGPGRLACPRNGAAHLHRRRARASGAARSRRKRVARFPRHRHRRHVRVVVRAAHPAHHRLARKPRPPRAPRGLARARVRAGAGPAASRASSALRPALRASAIKPAAALRGGEDPHSRHRIMHALVALQIAFCFVVHFVAGLFVVTFDRLSSQPTGFSSERILNLETSARRPQPLVLWQQVAEHLRTVPGVEKVALTVWPMMSGEADVGLHLRQWRAAQRSEFGYSARLARLVRYHADPHPRRRRPSRQRREPRMPRSSTNLSSNNTSTARTPSANGS